MITKKQTIYKNYKFIRSLFYRKPKEKFTIFIFGAHRSGTNMLAKAFDECFSIDVYHEEDKEAFRDYRIKDINEIQKIINKSWAQYILFKPICDSQNACEILSEIDNSCALWIYRDWNDVVNSSMKNFSNAFLELKLVVDSQDRGGWRGEKINEENLALVKKLVEREVSEATSRAVFWFLRNSLYFQLNLNAYSNVKLLKYEDLVSSPANVLHDVFSFCKIPWDNKYASFVHKKSIRKDNPPVVDEDVKNICDDLLKKMISAT